jgi:flagellar hook-associated protein 2
MTIEKQPITELQTKSETLTSEQNAFNTVLSQLLSLDTTLTNLKSGVTFRTNTTSSSNESALTATANSDAAVGSYNFTVLQTAQSNQVVSKGFSDSDTSSIGSGTMTIEIGNGTLNRNTDLSLLNGQAGITKGSIAITDRSGATAKIDLSTALTVADVLDAINTASGIGVTASVDGDSIKITDTSGGTGSLTIANVGSKDTATDLGIAGTTTSATLTGSDLISINENTTLDLLNDGNGVGTNGVASDMQITLSDGTSFGVDLDALTTDSSLDLLNNGQGIRDGSIKITNTAGATKTLDLSGAQTIQDVLDAINNSGLSLTASWVNGTQFSITDASKGTKTLSIENVSSGSTATDLGLESITAKKSTGDEVFRVTTLGDVKRVIEAAAAKATGNTNAVSLTVASDGKRLQFSDNTGGSGNLSIESVLDSTAAEDLGLAVENSTSTTITGDRIIAGLNTVLLKSLNGGDGVASGTIKIQTRDGNTANIDLTSAETLQDVLKAINNSGLSVTAALNDVGTGIKITDNTGSTSANFAISDVDSTTASDLNITADLASSSIDSGNNQLQYVSRATLLSSLNSGSGISAGSFTITSSKGTSGTLKLTSSDVSTMTVGNLIDKINALNIGVTASVNENGDGILLADTAGGAGTLTVADSGTGTTAADLNLKGSASATGSGTIDGSYEYKISIGGSDTLEDIADKINDLGIDVSASIIDDGSSTNACHLNLTSKVSGLNGNLVINTGNLDLGLFDMVEAQNAVITMGSGTSGMTISSNSNTFTGLVNGLTLTANGVSSSPVTITVSRDNDSLVEKMDSFVESFNTILSSINDLTAYEETEDDSTDDSDTDTTISTGLLFGNSTINTVESKLLNMINKQLFSSGEFRSLSQLGFSYDSDEGQLTFDEDTFTKAMEKNESAVESFFSTKDKGFAYSLSTIIDNFTDETSGLLTTTIDTYDTKLSNIEDRIDYLTELADAKEERLYKQFTNLEKVLASLQTQQNALDSILDTSSDDDDDS